MNGEPASRSSLPSPTEIDELRRLAISIASDAAGHAADGRRSLGPGRRVDHDTKSSVVDPVTRFDREAEDVVVSRLRRERPDDSIVGEEGANHRGSNDLEWHIDPIDGTVNFVYDLPGWCTSIGVLHRGEPLAAAVVAPAFASAPSAPLAESSDGRTAGSGEVYSAGRGLGAWLGDEPITASGSTDLSVSLVATGFSYHLDEHRNAQAARVAGVLPHVRDIRRSGSAALDLAFVAAGRLDGYFEEFLSSWDLAAGVLLVREAGGDVTAFDGGPLDVRRPAGVLAAGSGLHASLHDCVRRAG